MITLAEYLRIEKEFADCRNSLCENTPPQMCDCSKCPTRVLCEQLEKYYREVTQCQRKS